MALSIITRACLTQNRLFTHEMHHTPQPWQHAPSRAPAGTTRGRGNNLAPSMQQDYIKTIYGPPR